jgi:hypothetical protein
MKEMRLALALPFLLGLAVPMAGESLEQAASQIVWRLTSAGLARSATLTFQNLSSVPAVQANEVRDTVLSALRKAGIQTAEGQPEVRLTLSENPRGLLLIAEFADSVTIVPCTCTPSASVQRRHSLKLMPVHAQLTPILDFVLADSGATLIVLEPGRVGLYRRNDNGWTPSHAVVLNLARPLPRDPRGRLTGGPDDFRVSLPGSQCGGAVAPAPRSGGCKADNTWAADRNYFESSRGPYYTSAPAGTNILMAHVDRRARLWGEGSQPRAVVEGWGSDVAPIRSCSANPTVLATAAGNQEDVLEAFEIVENELTSVSDPIRLPGPVTALWPAETPGEVSVVVRNQKTGVYEASRVAIACAE